MVEFALVLFPLLLLVAGIIQFGIALNYWLDMQRIANQGARWAAVNNWPPDCPRGSTSCASPNTLQQTLQRQMIADGLQNNPTTSVQVCYPNGTYLTGDPVRIQIRSTFERPSDPGRRLAQPQGEGDDATRAHAGSAQGRAHHGRRGMFVRPRAKGLRRESGQVVVLFATSASGALRARRDRPGHRQLVRPQATSPDAGRRRGPCCGSQLQRLLLRPGGGEPRHREHRSLVRGRHRARSQLDQPAGPGAKTSG